MSEYQVRSGNTAFETRSEGGELTIEGYFVVFNQPYYVDSYMEEVVLPGAIDARTDTSDVRALVDHLPHLVLGRNTANTLGWSIDDIGLFGKIKVNAADTDAVNLHARIQRGDVNQCSFGFDEDRVSYVDLPDGRIRRQIEHISKLWELSVCTFPAYEQTHVVARNRKGEDIKAECLEHKKTMLKRRFKHA